MQSISRLHHLLNNHADGSWRYAAGTSDETEWHSNKLLSKKKRNTPRPLRGAGMFKKRTCLLSRIGPFWQTDNTYISERRAGETWPIFCVLGSALAIRPITQNRTQEEGGIRQRRSLLHTPITQPMEDGPDAVERGKSPTMPIPRKKLYSIKTCNISIILPDEDPGWLTDCMI